VVPSSSNTRIARECLFSSRSAGLNPARDLGPRLVTLAARWGAGSMKDFLPYLVGPLIGGPLGAFLAETVVSVV
jgi:glycerol uptake facilitator-like aquaporin